MAVIQLIYWYPYLVAIFLFWLFNLFYLLVLLRYNWLLVAKFHTFCIKVFFLSNWRVFITLGWAWPLNYYLLYIFLANFLPEWPKTNFRLLSMINYKLWEIWINEVLIQILPLYRSLCLCISSPYLQPHCCSLANSSSFQIHINSVSEKLSLQLSHS